MAFKDLRNLRLTSYDEGLMDEGEFLFDFGGSSLRRAALVFVSGLKLKVKNDLEQLLT